MDQLVTGQVKRPSKRRRNVIVFVAIAAVWIAFDFATKQYFDGAYSPGEAITAPILGVFRFHLVHNTGAAWGLFGQSTGILAVISLIVCVLLVGYFTILSKQGTLGEVFGLALVFAGGIGNAADRFTMGYVVDFIEFTFIDFPVFNVADIGVTCGFILFIASMLYLWSKEDRQRKEAEELKAAALGEGYDDGLDSGQMPANASDGLANASDGPMGPDDGEDGGSPVESSFSDEEPDEAPDAEPSFIQAPPCVARHEEGFPGHSAIRGSIGGDIR